MFCDSNVRKCRKAKKKKKISMWKLWVADLLVNFSCTHNVKMNMHTNVYIALNFAQFAISCAFLLHTKPQIDTQSVKHHAKHLQKLLIITKSLSMYALLWNVKLESNASIVKLIQMRSITRFFLVCSSLSFSLEITTCYFFSFHFFSSSSSWNSCCLFKFIVALIY